MQSSGARRTRIVVPDAKGSLWSRFRDKLSQFLCPAVLLFFATALIVPAAVYFCIVDLPEALEHDPHTCVITEAYRVPCGFPGTPGNYRMGNVSEKHCKSIHCCFDEHHLQCFHSLPSNYGYKLISELDPAIYTRKLKKSPVGTEMFENISIHVINVVNYVKISLLAIPPPQIAQNRIIGQVGYKIYQQTLAVDVFRKDRPEIILLQTARGPLIASNGYWEWSMQLTRENGQLFGLGGVVVHRNLSKVLYKSQVDHTTLPFFLAHHEGEFHAVVIEHDGILEVEVLDSKLIIMRGVHLTRLSLRLFPGPTLDDIYAQRDAGFIFRKMVSDVPRWMLGMHMCRNQVLPPFEAVQQWINEEAAVNRFPTQSDCFNELFTIFLIENEQNTIIRKMIRSVLNKITSREKFILPITPHIPIGEKYSLYKTALEMKVLIRNSTQQVHIGRYKDRSVVFLDFTAPNIQKYLEKLLELISKVIQLNQIDGVYLLDNWPQDDNYLVDPSKEKLDYYTPRILNALNKTLPLHLANGDLNQENYILKQIQVFETLLPHAKIISSSYIYSMRSPLLPQNVSLSWTKLKAATTAYLMHNLFLHPLSLSPVCGTGPNLIPDLNELCARWFINSALQPGQRLTKQWYLDENMFGSTRTVIDKAIALARELRYYQYTMFKASGYTNKAMFMDFYDDNETFTLNEQFMVGDLLVRQIVLPQVTNTRVYLPHKYNWYEFGAGKVYPKGWNELSIIRDDRIIFVKEGSIISLVQKIKEFDSQEGFVFLIAKQCNFKPPSIMGRILFDATHLEIEVSSEGLRLNNLKAIQNEIPCNNEETKRVHIFKVKGIIEYACNNEIYDNWESIDLCTIATNEYVIKYK